MFFTFWGLLALKKGYQPSGVTFDYKAYEGKLTEAMASGTIPGWKTVLEQGLATGRIKIHACSTSVGMFDLKKEDLESFIVVLPERQRSFPRQKDQMFRSLFPEGYAG